MTTITDLAKEVEASGERRMLVALLTYITMVIFMKSIQVNQPFLNAIVPTLGFLLSTLTMEKAKRLWEKGHKS